MPLPEAIDAIKAQLTNVFERPDVSTAGTNPTSAVYRSGIRTNIHGELVHTVTVDINKPPTRSQVTDGDIVYLHDVAQTFLEWIATQSAIGDMLIWWEQPPSVEFDYDEGASAYITIPLCERYPRA